MKTADHQDFAEMLATYRRQMVSDRLPLPMCERIEARRKHFCERLAGVVRDLTDPEMLSTPEAEALLDFGQDTLRKRRDRGDPPRATPLVHCRFDFAYRLDDLALFDVLRHGWGESDADD